jgi:hypothetical protein
MIHLPGKYRTPYHLKRSIFEINNILGQNLGENDSLAMYSMIQQVIASMHLKMSIMLEQHSSQNDPTGM